MGTRSGIITTPASPRSERIHMATVAQRAIDSTAKRLSHGDRVELNVNSQNLLSEPEEIFESWRRCLLDYRVDARNVLGASHHHAKRVEGRFASRWRIS